MKKTIQIFMTYSVKPIIMKQNVYMKMRPIRKIMLAYLTLNLQKLNH